MTDDKTLRFIMVGGFLGAGKTTTLAELARRYMSQGLRVGLVTNDQADNLVDTNNLRGQGFAVTEVAGACFCCRFDELVEKVQALTAQERPDVILAEPVGSCTDLVATVIQPLKDLYADRFDVAPYAVLFKPSHGLRILRHESGGGFSPKAEYIFRKQLEEADLVLINRIDELQPGAVDELAALVEKEYPGVRLLRVSARTGQGFDVLMQLLDQTGPHGQKILDIDYDIYAEGEAELGWHNSSTTVTAQQPFELDALLMAVIERLYQQLAKTGGEVAHLKVIGLGENSFGVANLVSSHTLPELSIPSRDRVLTAELVVNARVAMDPQVLEQEVHDAIESLSEARGAQAVRRSVQSLRPGRPTPTHRYAAAKS